MEEREREVSERKLIEKGRGEREEVTESKSQRRA